MTSEDTMPDMIKSPEERQAAALEQARIFVMTALRDFSLLMQRSPTFDEACTFINENRLMLSVILEMAANAVHVNDFTLRDIAMAMRADFERLNTVADVGTPDDAEEKPDAQASAT